jgi:hypothetical protein
MVGIGVPRFLFGLGLALAICVPLACGSDSTSADASSGGQAGTSGTGGASGATAASGGQAGAVGYPCPNAGPFLGQAGLGDIEWIPTVPTSQCVVGESYCSMQTDNLRGLSSASCVSFASSPALADCAQDPSCACFCSHVGCGQPRQCSCEEEDGFARLICGEF